MQTTVTPAFRKTTDTFTAGATTLPQRYFVSPEIFAKEQEEVFSSAMGVRRASESDCQGGGLFCPGGGGRKSDYCARSKGDAARVLSMSAAIAGRGCAKSRADIPRRFNARITPGPMRSTEDWSARRTWTGGDPGFDKDDYSLHAVNLALWEGFIFVNLAEEPAPLEEWFAPLVGKFSHWNLPQAAFGETDRVRCARQLEADLRKLFGVLSLPGSASDAVESLRPTISAENDLT